MSDIYERVNNAQVHRDEEMAERDSPYDEIVRLRSQLIARQAELIAKEAELQLPENQRILEIRRLEEKVAWLQTPEGKADYFGAWQAMKDEAAKLRADLKNTSRDYSELRESYDKLFERHQTLCDKHNEILRQR